MLIAIDHGNYAIKTPHTAFLSGLAEHKVKPPLAEEVVEYGGSYWTLSGKRLPYMRDKTRDSRFFVLTLFAIGRELERRGPCFPSSKSTWPWACLPNTMECSGTSLPSTSAGVW